MSDAIANDKTDRMIASDRVEGTKVYNLAGEKLGAIHNFMVEKRSGQACYAVMEFGGFLGIGNEYYPLPWDMLNYDPDLDGYVVDIDESRLEGAPNYAPNISPVFSDAYGRGIFGYWGLAYPFV